MTDGAGRSYSYGEPNWEMIGRWLELPPDADGPFWAVNLMRYRPVAEYRDGRAGVSGREADDAYAPLGPLAAIGAMVAFLGEVADQPAGEPRWDRVGVVRYPSRSAFFAMQQRNDFKEQHVHKEAGMEFTIVASCLPRADEPVRDEGSDGVVVMRARRFVDPAARPADDTSAAAIAVFDVEGVIVGDDRTWHEVRFDLVPDVATVAELSGRLDGVDEMITVVLEPRIDNLVASIVTADSVERSRR
jgi:hypothetical protein